MKKGVMQKWVKALRSGEYKQAKGSLRNRDGYCCLGVLCKVMGMRTNGNTELTDAMMKKSGITTRCGDLDVRGSLAEKNDAGKTFEEIADIIEAKYKDL